jgi:hypothetical protein
VNRLNQDWDRLKQKLAESRKANAGVDLLSQLIPRIALEGDSENQLMIELEHRNEYIRVLCALQDDVDLTKHHSVMKVESLGAAKGKGWKECRLRDEIADDRRLYYRKRPEGSIEVRIEPKGDDGAQRRFISQLPT